MTPQQAAKYLGALGGKANTGRKSPAHREAIANGQRAAWARRLADAARVAAVCDTERGAMLAARRTIDDHAPRALARDRGTRELPRLLQGGCRLPSETHNLAHAGSTPAPVTTNTDGRPAARAGAALTVATRQATLPRPPSRR
jgi:hypothetical protein